MKLEAPTPWNMCHTNQVVNAALFRKSDWEKYGGYDENMKKGLEDWEFWLNFILDKKKFYCISEVLFYYRILKISRNHGICAKTRRQLFRYVYRKHKKLYFYLWAPKIAKIFYQKKFKHSQSCYKIKVLGITVFKKYMLSDKQRLY